MVRPPVCSMVADRHWLITASAMGHTQVGELRHGPEAASQAVDRDLPSRVDCPDRRDRPTDHGSMVLARHAVLSGIGWLVDQVEAEVFASHFLVAAGEGFPQENEGVLGDLICPEIVSLQVIAVGTIARRAMKIEGQMNAARPTSLQVLIDVAENRLVRMEVIEVLCPKVIINRDAHEVEPESGQKVQRPLVNGFRFLVRAPAVHPLEIESIMLLHSLP